MSEMRFAQLEPWLPRVSLWILALCISALNKNINLDLFSWLVVSRNSESFQPLQVFNPRPFL